PAVKPAERGQLHPANADPPRTNHHNQGSLNTPRNLRGAREPDHPSLAPALALALALITSALSAAPREPRCSAPSARAGNRAEGAESRGARRDQRTPAPTPPGP